MTTTFRNALLALVLILGLALDIKAQDRYEYASIAYAISVGKSYIMVVSTATSSTPISGKISEGNAMLSTSPIIAQTEEMGKEGWEVYNTAFSPTGNLYYFLKRKLK